MDDGIAATGAGADDGRLADNIALFARALRRAGMRVGSAAAVEAVEAVRVIGIGSRETFYWTLHAVFVNRHEDRPVFDETFGLFWRSRGLVEKTIAMFSPVRAERREKTAARAAETRASQAMRSPDERRRTSEAPQVEIDARATSSANEVLRRMDFARMTAQELAEARRALAGLVLPCDRAPTRRHRPDNRGGRVDPRATMRAALKTGGAVILPRFCTPRLAHPPLVVLADISGSMSPYTRVLLHFFHMLAERRRRVHVFLFGTRLTNVTRQLRHRDPDEAFDACAAAVADWSGGTRIGETLAAFNRLWSRRVLGQGAVVLLVSDGLEREGIDGLSAQMERLQKSCRRFVWLNPLLRFEGFEAKAGGVRAMLTHVDEFRPVHNLEALADLVAALEAGGRDTADPRRYLEAVH